MPLLLDYTLEWYPQFFTYSTFPPEIVFSPFNRLSHPEIVPIDRVSSRWNRLRCIEIDTNDSS